jgi:AraC-like DNA-binding protein
MSARSIALAFAKQVAKRPQEDVPRHTHPVLEIVYVERGRGTSAFAGANHVLAPHRLCVVPAGVAHDQRNPGGMVTRCLGLVGHALDGCVGCWTDRDGAIGRAIARLLAELEHRQPAWERMTHGLACEIAALVERAACGGSDDARRELVERALSAIAQSDGMLSVGELSERLFVSRDYLRHLVHEYTGRSPMRHLIVNRVARAAERLRSDDRPVAVVAADCGFDNPYYFSRLFRQVQGCTPTQWRAGGR